MSWKKHLPLTLDVAAVAVLFALGLVVMLAYTGEGSLPFWARSADVLMEGPDAGEWAINTLRVSWGDFDAVDVHRPPLWLIATALALQVTPDIAMAGHLVNHLTFLGLPLVAYGLGRADGGPAAGLASGLVILGCTPLIEASRRYGCDPLVAFVLPLSVLCALPLRRWWFLAPLSGVVAGLAASSHITALPYILPAALVIAVRGPTRAWWHRLAALGLYAVGVGLILWLMAKVFGLVDLDDIQRVVSEGIDPQHGDIGNRRPELSTEAASKLETDWAEAATASLRAGLQKYWFPRLSWTLLLALPWLGVLGLGLGVAKGAGRWRYLRWQDAGYGLALLCCLAPLPVLHAAGAEPRYSANLLAFVAVLIGRGLCSLPGLLELGLRERWAWFPRGVLALPLAAWIGTLAWDSATYLRAQPRPTDQYALAARHLGMVLSEHVPGGGGAAVPIREAVAYAGREFCPKDNCPFGETELHFSQCVEIIRDSCAGAGAIPYVVVRDGPLGMGDETRFQDMGDWMIATYGILTVVRSSRFTAEVISVPREDTSVEDLELSP